MDKLLDCTNSRQIEINTEFGSKQALQILVSSRPDLLEYVDSLVEKLGEYLIDNPQKLEDTIYKQFAYLKYIGLSEDIKFSDFRQVDSYYYLKMNDWDQDLTNAVLFCDKAKKIANTHKKDTEHLFSGVSLSEIAEDIMRVVSLVEGREFYLESPKEEYRVEASEFKLKPSRIFGK